MADTKLSDLTAVVTPGAADLLYVVQGGQSYKITFANLTSGFASSTHNHTGTYQPLDSDLTALAAISGVRGDVIYYGASGWTRLAVGTSGYVLTSNGTDPAWAAASGGTSDHAALTHLAWTDTGHTGTAGTLAGFAAVTGAAASYSIGTTAGTVAAGDHTHTGVYAAASHTHAASDVASGTFDAARIPDLSGTYAAASHAHGNITSAGAIGSTSGLPVITTTSGVLTVGAFGTSSGQFAEGNHTHAQLHDAVTIADSTTIDLTLSGQQISAAVIVQMSITSDASGLKLSGDSASPGNSKLYGTNGSGTKGWYDQPAGGAGVSDGDKGDITVSSSGATWTIDDGVVTLAKMANLAQDKIIGRATASTGVPEAITCTAAGRALLDDADAAAQRETLGFGSGTPTAGQIPVGNAGGTAYAPVSVSGSGATISLASTGVMTISGIANASLANSSVTVTAGTGLSGGGAVSLGGSVTLSVAYGTTSTTACVGNDSRLSDSRAAASVSTSTTTAISGLLKGATTLAAATAGTDYVAPGGALGTPASGTLTNCTGLPLAGLSDAGAAGKAVAGLASIAKGGLVVGSGTNTVAALAVGATDGHALQVAAAATNGVQWAAIAGRYLGTDTLTYTDGTEKTYTVPAGVTSLLVEVQGAGGGGGGCVGGTGTAAAGGGGAAGGYCRKYYSSLAASYNYTVGAGGAAGSSSGGAGGAGGDTKWNGTAVLAPGGLGGSYMTADTTVTVGFGASANTTAASGGDINIDCIRGGWGLRASGTSALGGFGGQSMLGYPGYNKAGSDVGITGPGYGGGGGGASSTSSTGKAGGAGANGVILVHKYS